MNKEQIFYIVINEEFPTTITYRHTNYEDAEKEAQRLARKVRGQHFIVMRAVKGFKFNDLIETGYFDSDGLDDGELIPF